MQVSLSTKIIRNVISSAFRALLLVPVPFVMTPLVLKKVGPAGYGTWAVLVALNGLTSLADLGMVGTVSKYVAEYHAQQDSHSLNRLLNTGLAIFFGISLAVGLFMWFGSPLLVRLIFKGSAVGALELVVLLRMFLIVIAANILNLLFSSVTSGLQRLDISNWISAANVLGAALIGAVLLLRGWGVRGLVLGQMCSTVCTVVIYAIAVKLLLPKTLLHTRFVDLSEARKMFSFSLRLYLTQAAVAVHNQLEKFLLALFVGVSAAGWYDIASDLALKLRGVISLVLGPVLPAASELDALKDQYRLGELYFRAQKYLAFLGFPVAVYVSLVAKTFVELWIGPKLAFIAVPLVILLWVNLFNLLSGPGFLIFAGRGFLKPGIQSALFGMGLNIVLSVGLIYRFGFPGAVIGTTFSLILATSFFLYLFHSHTGYSVARLIRNAFWKPFATSAVLAVPVWFVLRAVTPSFPVLAGIGVVYGAFYIVAILLNRFLDHYEWGKIENLLPALRHFRRNIPLA